ncbi:carbohydrate kinase family protein [Spirillospora sp. CA-142024]|uniref:carbohydrate kinase family protein n=1 Tax=Spirillospora sp. CA-142024 TaxID=3240036 RepID=UPI003D92C630
MNHIAVIGEAVADAFLPGAGDPGEGLRLDVRPGGGPANTAVALARLGTPTRFLGRLNGGPFGRMLRRHLVASGVDVSGAVEAPENATLAVTAVGPDGQAAYDFYAEGTADWQWTGDELEARIPHGACAVHTGSLALVTDPGGPLIEDLLERMRPHATISVDPNVRPGIVPSATYRERLARWTRQADVLRLSDDDLRELVPDGSFEEVAKAWHADGVALVVLTLGAGGAVASLRGRPVEVPAVAVRAVDTVGAGDAFMAGMLHALGLAGRLGGRLDDLDAEDVRAALGFAARVAAETVRVPGADPPWAHRLPADVLDPVRGRAPAGADRDPAGA